MCSASFCLLSFKFVGPWCFLLQDDGGKQQTILKVSRAKLELNIQIIMAEEEAGSWWTVWSPTTTVTMGKDSEEEEEMEILETTAASWLKSNMR